MGKLIVLEAVDGSGKTTQTRILFNRLIKEGHKVRKIKFPTYRRDFSSHVNLYLKGAFGDNPDSISPYISSTFYAVDRYASFKTDWQGYLEDGGIIIADRYTTSNMVHQASKIEDQKEKDKFLDWLWDFEFGKFELPRPDLVLFLDVPPEYSLRAIKRRQDRDVKDSLQRGKGKGRFDHSVKSSDDIHEKNPKHLESSYLNAKYVAQKYGWDRVECVKNNKLLSVKEISNRIYERVSQIIL